MADSGPFAPALDARSLLLASRHSGYSTLQLDWGGERMMAAPVALRSVRRTGR